MASTVDICNIAIGWLAGNLITDLADDSVEAKLCAANFDSCRDAVLEDKAWTFAIKRDKLARLAETAIPESFKNFLRPADCIRILRESAVPYFDDYLYWVVEGERILAETDILFVKYIRRIEDTEKFSANFVQALAARLSADLAIPLTESSTIQKTMWTLYENKLYDAGNTDGMQGRAEKFRSNYLVNVRR